MVLISFCFAFPPLAGYYYIKSSERYIERITSIKLPVNTTAIKIDETDWAIFSKFVIDKEKIPSFSQTCHLPALGKQEKHSLSFFMLMDSLNRPSIDDSTEYGYVYDCKGKNAWHILLNKITGELWITVEFPDMSGDAPACDK